MRHFVIELTQTTTAAPEQVWRWLADGGSWSSWTRLSSTELEREGVPEPDGVGAVRKFGRAGRFSREEVVVFEPPHRFAYVLLDGLPIRNYRSDVTLTPEAGGTRIVWHSEFDERYRGTGPLLRRFLRSVLSDIARSLIRQAERRSD